MKPVAALSSIALQRCIIIFSHGDAMQNDFMKEKKCAQENDKATLYLHAHT